MYLYIRCWFILMCVLPPQSCCCDVELWISLTRWRSESDCYWSTEPKWAGLRKGPIMTGHLIDYVLCVYSTETKLFEWSLPVDGRWDDTTSGSSLKSTVSVWKWRWVQCRPPQWRSLPLPVPLRWAAGCSRTAEGLVLQQDVAGGRHSWGQRWWSRTYGSDPMLYRNRFSVIRALSFHSD